MPGKYRVKKVDHDFVQQDYIKIQDVPTGVCFIGEVYSKFSIGYGIFIKTREDALSLICLASFHGTLHAPCAVEMAGRTVAINHFTDVTVIYD